MINKKNIWFLTLFSLILVLSVYYVTMPKELLLTNLTKIQDTITEDSKVDIESSNAIEAMKVEENEKKDKEMETLKQVLMDSNSSAEKKNEAFDKMKSLDINNSKEEELNQKIKEKFKFDAYTKIDGDNIKIIVDSDNKDLKTANNIMRSVQENFDTKKYITVEFK